MRPNKITKKIIFLIVSGLIVGCEGDEKSDGDFLKKGVELYSKGDYAKAEIELKTAIQKNPGAAESYYYMALLNEKSQNFKAMKNNLQEALKLNPNNNDARVKLGKVHLLFGDIDEALKEVEQVLIQSPDSLEAKVVKAAVFEKKQNDEEAFKIIEGVLEKDPKFIDALALKTMIFIKNQAYEDGLATIQKALSIDNNNVSFHLLKVQIHFNQKDVQAIIDDYEQLIAIQPENDEIKYALSRAYLQANNQQKAEAILRGVVEKKPESIKPKILLLEYFFNQKKQIAINQLHEFSKESKPQELLDFAKWTLTKNEVNEAETLLNKTIQESDGESKEKATALFLLATIEFQKKNYDVVLEKIRESLSVNPDFIEAKILKAKVYLAKKEHASAEELLNKILWEKPDSDGAMVLLGRMYLEQGNRDKANANFAEALKINPINFQALLPVIENTLAGKHYDYVKELLLNALSKQPESLDLMQMLARVNIADKKWDIAEKIIKEIEKKKNGQLVGRFLTAYLSSERGQCEKAVDVYKDILVQMPKQEASLKAMAGCYERLGKRSVMLQYLNEFITENTDSIPAQLLKSQLLALDGKVEEAISQLNKLISLEGDLASVYLEIAKLYAKQGNKEQALEAYRRGLEKYPSDIKILMSMAKHYELERQVDKAIEFYEKVLAIDNGQDVAKNNLANLLLENNTNDAIQKAVELTAVFNKSEQPYFLDTFGWANFKKGNINEAANALNKVIILAPDVPVFRYHLAEIYSKQGNNSSAILELRQALELGKKQSFSEKVVAEELLKKLSVH